MPQSFRVLWRAVIEFERYGWLFVITNLLAAVLSIPIVTLPAAYAALSHLSHAAQTGTTATYSDFWEGFKLYLWRGIVLGIVNIAILGILYVNFSSYGSQTSLLFRALRVVWITILVLWLGIQLYVWPILEEMEQPTLRGALRNAAVMVLLNPFFTLILLAVIGVVGLISTIVVAPWLLLTASLIACIGNAAVLNRLQVVRS